MSHRDLHSEHIPLATAGTSHDKQADILIADRIKVSNVLFHPTHSNVAFKIIVIRTEILFSFLFSID